MRHASFILIFALSLLFFHFAFSISYAYDPFYGNVISTETIRARYQSQAKEGNEEKVRVLIVPGHSKSEGGTNFGGIYERDLNVLLSYELADLLKTDPHLQVWVARERDGSYAPWLVSYFGFTKEIEEYRQRLKVAALSRVTQSSAATADVYHNVASTHAAYELFAINKFANDNKIDIVYHVHINDYPRKNANHPGLYRGFVIYVPDTSYTNSRVSVDIATPLKKVLSRFIPTSSHPQEATGIVPDRELIAVGSNGSRVGASVLMEYGYIYEPAFQNPRVRPIYLKLLALLTYAGFENYFTSTEIL